MSSASIAVPASIAAPSPPSSTSSTPSTTRTSSRAAAAAAKRSAKTPSSTTAAAAATAAAAVAAAEKAAAEKAATTAAAAAAASTAGTSVDDDLKTCGAQEYLRRTIFPSLSPALTQIERERPSDPIEALAIVLYQQASTTRSSVQRLEQLRGIVEQARNDAIHDFNVKGRV